MFSKKHLIKSVIMVTDDSLSYATLAKNKLGFFVQQHETVELPKGIIVRGEILKADLLFNIFKKIAGTISNKSIDILLGHDYFLCSDGVLPKKQKETSLKERVQEYFKNTAESEPWHKTHICEFSTHTVQGKEKVLFKCLPKDIQKSYIHIAKRAGFKVSSMSSDILAFDHLLDGDRTIGIFVSDENVRIADFKSNMFTSHKKFQVSYNQFTQDIVKLLNISKEDARDILDQHGLLRSHKDEKVYTRLTRSISPLIDFLSKRKTKESISIKVIFDENPIPGFADFLIKALRIKTSELDVLYTDKYTFQDILSLHRDESYQYSAHIAQALKFWKK